MPTHQIDAVNGPVGLKTVTRAQFINIIEYLKHDPATVIGILEAALEAASAAGFVYREADGSIVIKESVDVPPVVDGVEEITGNATLSLATRISCLNATAGGPYAIVLPNGTYSGQQKTILCKNPSTTVTWNLTGTMWNFTGAIFDITAGSLELRWDGTHWHQPANAILIT